MAQTRDLYARYRYLHLPVQNGAPKRTLRLSADGEPVREFEIELAAGQPDFWVFLDLSDFEGQRLTLAVEGDDLPPGALETITQSDRLPEAEALYREAYRPQFHFSSRRGWNNDPNGLLYHRGRYHLFYQHNPYGWKWGNMTWGHAVSADLVHWHELGDALYPDERGTIFSGSGVVDHENTSGFGDGHTPPLVLIYTAAGGTSPASQGQPFTQCLAYSADGGETWRKYAHNPVVGHIAGHNRDPKVLWHAPTRRWVMALYLDANTYALLTSPDLKQWTLTQRLDLPGCTECPDLFPLAVNDNPAETRWVFWGANGAYFVGAFDGQTFTPQGAAQRFDWGGNSYAAQTWSDIPSEDGRRIQIAWLRVELLGMPFNQCMTFPCELTLRATPDGPRLAAQPVREIDLLHDRAHIWRALTLRPGENLLAAVQGELFDLRCAFRPDNAATVEFMLRGVPLVYDVAAQQLTIAGRTAPLAPVDGCVSLRVLIDRTSIEVFGNDGLVALPLGLLPRDDHALSLTSRGGEARVEVLEIDTLRSAWGV